MIILSSCITDHCCRSTVSVDFSIPDSQCCIRISVSHLLPAITISAVAGGAARAQQRRGFLVRVRVRARLLEPGAGRGQRAPARGGDGLAPPVPPPLAHAERRQGGEEHEAEQRRAAHRVEEDVSEVPLAGGAALEAGDVVLDHHHRQPVAHLVREGHGAVHEGRGLRVVADELGGEREAGDEHCR